MLNGPFDDQQASKGQLFRYLKALNKLERKLDGTAPWSFLIKLKDLDWLSLRLLE